MATSPKSAVSSTITLVPLRFAMCWLSPDEADRAEFTTYGIFDPIALIPAQVNPPSPSAAQQAEPQLFFVERAYRLWDNAFWVPLISASFMCVSLESCAGEPGVTS